MNILFIGDIFGKNGIRAISKHLSKVKKEYKIDFTIANAENTTLCRGLNMEDYNELCNLGIDFFTMGNHTWRQKDFAQVLSKQNIIRPHNINGNIKYSTAGVGFRIIELSGRKILIANIMGSSVTLNPVMEINIDNPFRAFEEIIANNKADIYICDFHSETTSEKNCFFQYFKQNCTCILGTHSHVQTNDAQVRQGTAYITDVGMTGPANSIIGADSESLIKMFIGESERFMLTEAETGEFQFNAVVITIDDKTNKATNIKPINILN